MFSLVTSTTVLVVLLIETTKLYARLSHSNVMLQNERDSKLINIETVVASIAHEVRQPLTAIVSNSSAALGLLEKSPPDLGEVRTILKEIIDAGHHTDNVFDSLGNLFGKSDQAHRLIDVNEIALSTLQNLGTELQANGIEVRRALMRGLPLVQGHHAQFRQAILNLVRNAVEAMSAVTKRNRVLRITTGTAGNDAIFIEVEDSGPGIPPDKVAGVFEPFVTTKPDGLGLGLAICKMIVEAHGGNISAANGETGALFRFVLPVGGP